MATETFLIAWRRRDELPRTPLPWLIGTARKVLANQRRSDQRTDALTLRIRHQPAAEAAGTVQAVETRERWAAALRQLSPTDQEVIALIAWDGLTGREAARSLGCHESAFLMRLHRARRRLARHLAETDEPDAPVRSGRSMINNAAMIREEPRP